MTWSVEHHEITLSVRCRLAKLPERQRRRRRLSLTLGPYTVSIGAWRSGTVLDRFVCCRQGPVTPPADLSVEHCETTSAVRCRLANTDTPAGHCIYRNMRNGAVLNRFVCRRSG